VASRTQRPGVSLDQMLVALFRGNPDAFVGDNMNRLKSGVVLSVPSGDAAGKVTPAEARELIQAQSADFSAYRQRLAAGTTTVAEQAPARQATGKVQAAVEDRKQGAAPAPDKLTLSQGGVKPGPESKISKEAEKKDAASRLAELSRNVDELKKLQQGAAATPAAKATAPAAIAPAPPVAPPSPAAAPTPPAAAPSPMAAAPVASPAPPAAAPAEPPAAPPPAASAPPAAPKVAPKVAAPPPIEEPGFLASLLENPLVLPAGGVLIALLAGLGIYRLRGRMRKQGGETSFLESRLQPDSFFGASGGQRIDTREAASTSSGAVSSMSYSLSQLDAIGDVDPVAEADVYLAYGRDLQAEEILKEAMRANPERMAIRIKLLEVYLKRRDIKGFELLATQVYTLTRGAGEDWAKAQELGRQIDADNKLYQPGGAPELEVGPGGKVIEPLDATTMPHTAKPSMPQMSANFVPAADAKLDPDADAAVDLDLDLGGDHGPAAVPPIAPPPPIAPAAMNETMPPEPLTLPAMPRSAPAPSGETPSEMGGLDFDLGDLPIEAPRPAAPPPPAESRLDFGDFSIGGVDTQPPPLDGDPLARKLELAEEFRQIGDLEGARDLLEEVIAKSEGALKSKAQGMLQGLG